VTSRYSRFLQLACETCPDSTTGTHTRKHVQAPTLASLSIAEVGVSASRWGQD